MPPPSLFTRLRRARIVQVLLVYLGASWAVVQVADVLQEALELPDWILPVTVLLLLVGMVIILSTAWVQSLPSTTAREEAGEVPSDWEIAPADVIASLRAGSLPHLTWGRAIVGGVLALSLLFGTAGAWVLFTGQRLPLAPGELEATEAATGIAVVPFSVNGEGLDVFREGMVDLLSTGLDGLGGFRAIDSRTVLARWRNDVGDGDAGDLAASLRVADAAGARYAVLGSAVSLAGRVRLTAELYSVEDGAKIGQAQAEGSPDAILELADELSVNVIRELLGSEGSTLVSESQAGSLNTSSVDALRSYLQGEALMRRGEFERAASAYEEAVDRDSTFAMAYYRLTSTYGWMEAGGDRVERAELALRALAEDLPPRDRLLLEGEEALATGDPDGIALMEEMVKRYPDDPDAWTMLGELYAHGGDRLYRGVSDVHRVYAEAVALDPTFSPNYIHYTESAMLLDRPQEARELLDTYLRLAPATHQGTAMALGWDLQFGDEAARAAARAVLDTLGLHTSSDMTNGLAHTPRGLDALVAVADVNAGRSRSARWSGMQIWARVHAGRLDEAVRLHGELDDETNGVTDGYGLRLAGLEAGGGVAPDACRGYAPCLMILGAEAAKRDDDRALASVRAAFDEASSREDASPGRLEWLQVSRDAVEAVAAWRGGDPDGAFYALSGIRLRPAARGYPSELVRLWMGEIAVEQGRAGVAEQVLASLDRSSLGWYALLLRARAKAGAGDADGAAELYRRFLTLWEAAPGDHPFATEARDAVGA